MSVTWPILLAVIAVGLWFYGSSKSNHEAQVLGLVAAFLSFTFSLWGALS